MRQQTALTVGAEQRLEYIELPFEVGDDVEQVTVHYRVVPLGPGPCTVDLGLADPSGLRGWSGSCRTEVFVRASSATPGYRPGPLCAGRWRVVLGAYEVPQAGCRVEVEFEAVEARARWLGGDPHVHSLHSDGAWTLEELVAAAEAEGLSWLGVADHNTTAHNLCLHTNRPVTRLPAVERTSYRGHACLLGAEEPVGDFRCRDARDVEQAFARARAAGALVVLAHPMDPTCPSCEWRWGFDLAFDAVEVWNGPWREANRRALQWWQAQLEAGRRLVALGGSDAHRPGEPARIGEPITWVWARRCERAELLDAIRQGRVCVNAGTHQPRIFFQLRDAPPDGEPLTHLTAGALQAGALQAGALRLVCEQPNDPEPGPDAAAPHPVQVGASRELRLVGDGGRVWVLSEPGEGLRPQYPIGPDAGIRFDTLVSFLRAELWERPTGPGEPARLVALSGPVWVA